jgi:5-methylthioadenosine/S-adenosylhomocysteine deaminase
MRDGAVLVRGGRIAALGPTGSLGLDASGVRHIELADAALLPGLVNVHAHLELTALRGFLEELDFFRWIRKLTDTKYERLEERELLASARWGVVEATRAGITTLGEVCDAGVSYQAIVEGGLRAVVYQEVFGPDPAQAEGALENLDARIRAYLGAGAPRIRIGVSPHAPYTVSDRLLCLVTELALERGLAVTIHAAESAAEEELVRAGTGPFADFLSGRGIPVEARGCSTVEHLDDLGVLRCRPLLVHCVRCSAEDLRRMAAAGCAIAHCPKSNLKLGHGAAPWREMRRHGVRVGLGTDGVVSNNSCDLFEEARCAALVDRGRLAGLSGSSGKSSDAPPTAREILQLLTLDGAAALGLEGEIGSIEAGKAADLCAVDLSGPHVQPLHDVETALVWSASARDVVFTMVEGEVLWADGKLARCDEAALAVEVRRIAAKLA